MPKIPALGWIALIVGAILLLKPKATVAQNSPQGGPSFPGGRLGQSSMGTALSKPKTDKVTTHFSFTASTKNSAGTLIAWIYKYQVDLVGVVDGVSVQAFNSLNFVSDPGTFPVAIDLSLISTTELKLYQTVVRLWVAASKADGTFDETNMLLVDTKTSMDTVAIALSAATPAGNIVSPVTLTQRIAYDLLY